MRTGMLVVVLLAMLVLVLGSLEMYLRTVPPVAEVLPVRAGAVR